MRRHLILAGILVLACAGCARAADPVAPAPRSVDTMELHGTFHGERFWARLKAGEEAFGGNRFLRLLYTQPTREVLGGTILIDHPIILLNASHLGIQAWNEAHSGVGLSGIMYEDQRDPPGYLVVQGFLDGEGEDAVETTRQERLPGGLAWDARLAPVIMAFAYDKSGPPVKVTARDFFAAVKGEAIPIRWDADSLTIGETTYAVEADADGRLKSLTPEGAEKPLLTITEWLKGG